MAKKTENKTYTLELDEVDYSWVVAGLFRELWHWQQSGHETFEDEIEGVLRNLGEIE